MKTVKIPKELHLELSILAKRQELPIYKVIDNLKRGFKIADIKDLSRRMDNLSIIQATDCDNLKWCLFKDKDEEDLSYICLVDNDYRPVNVLHEGTLFDMEEKMQELRINLYIKEEDVRSV